MLDPPERRRATWRWQPRRLPAALGLTFGASAVSLLVIRLLVGPISHPPWSDALGWVPPLVLGVVLNGALGDIGDVRADVWLRRRRVASTSATRALVRQWLPLTRTLRGVGVIAPALFPLTAAWLTQGQAMPPSSAMHEQLLDLTTLDLLPGPAPLSAIGYALGAVVAELLRPHALRTRRGTGVVGADLRPRTATAYVQPLARWGPRVLAVACVAAAGATSWPADATGSVDPTVAAILSVVVLAVVELTRRVIVHRPQRVPDTALADADDAARASTVHGVAGAAIGLLGGVLGALFTDFAFAENGGQGWLGVVGAAIGLASIGVWIGYSTDLVWVVRRGGRPPVSPGGSSGGTPATADEVPA